MKTPASIRRARRGASLFITAMLMSTLTIVAAVTFSVVRMEYEIASHHSDSVHALYRAEACLNAFISEINTSLEAGSLALAGSNVSVNLNPPAGFSCEPVTNLVQLADPSIYKMTINVIEEKASASIEASFRIKRLLPYTLFGEELVSVIDGMDVYSYDAVDKTDPSSSDQTQEVSLASNACIISGTGSEVHGALILGRSALGAQATYFGTQYTYPVARINPDPLGVLTGEFAPKFVEAAQPANNQNAALGSAMQGNHLKLLVELGGPTGTFTPTEAVTLQSDQRYGEIYDAYSTEQVYAEKYETLEPVTGEASVELTLEPGTYYFESVYLGPDTVLNIDTTTGPVIIYLTGAFRAEPNSEINLVGPPGAFWVVSNSTQPVEIYSDSRYQGLLYAPYAWISLNQQQKFQGIAWGKRLYLHGGQDSYVDTAILDAVVSDNVELMTWKEIR